jgi:hypothetical protein
MHQEGKSFGPHPESKHKDFNQGILENSYNKYVTSLVQSLGVQHKNLENNVTPE